MSSANVFTKINREYYQLTGAERKIADHIMLQRQECQFMSISELAEAAEVAEATVSRFCRRLGYRGYSAFKLAVAGSTAVDPPANPPYDEAAPEDSVAEMCRQLYAADVDAITQTLTTLDPACVTAAADLLLAADRVLCMGLGGSMILAREAAHLFSTAFPNFYAVDDSHHQAIRAAMLTPKDAIIYFSYSGSTRDMLDLMKLAKERGAGIVLITRFPKSPGAALSDIVLECSAKEAPLQMGSVAARIGQLYLTDVLFNEMCRRDMEGCQERRRQVAEALAGKHL